MYERINEDGREWTYDTAWQNIRVLNADLDAGNLASVREDALFIASQMERLATGKAGPLTSPDVSALLDDVSRDAKKRDSAENLRAAQDLGQLVQERFDRGDFQTAMISALSLHATAVYIEDSD